MRSSAPVVTGHPDLSVVDQMIDLVLAYLEAAHSGTPGSSSPHAMPGGRPA